MDRSFESYSDTCALLENQHHKLHCFVLRDGALVSFTKIKMQNMLTMFAPILHIKTEFNLTDRNKNNLFFGFMIVRSYLIANINTQQNRNIDTTLKKLKKPSMTEVRKVILTNPVYNYKYCSIFYIILLTF